MKHLLLGCLLLIAGVCQGQIEMLSKEIKVYDYNVVTKNYDLKQTRESDNYITWRDNKLSIVCRDCETSKFTFTITRRTEKDEALNNGLIVDTYEGYRVPSGDEVTIIVGYRKGSVVSISLAYSGVMVIYNALENY